MLLETLSEDFRRIRATNTTDNGFPSRIPRTTEPTGIGDDVAQATASAIVDLRNGSIRAQNKVLIKPFGTDANDETFSLRVIGWRKIIEAGVEATSFWDPTMLAQLACTLSSTPVGLAGRIVDETNMFADTITITTGNADYVDVLSPTGDVAGHAIVMLLGYSLLEITFTTGASAASCNALIALL